MVREGYVAPTVAWTGKLIDLLAFLLPLHTQRISPTLNRYARNTDPASVNRSFRGTSVSGHTPHHQESRSRKQGSHVREAASTFGHLTHFSGQCQPADLSLFGEWCFTDMPSISPGTAHETKALQLRTFGCSFDGALHKSISVPRLYCATRSALGINDIHYDQVQRIDERNHGSAGIFAASTVPQ